MSELLKFAAENPWLFFFSLCVIAWVLTSPLHFGFRAYNQTLRSRNIVAHGWPAAPIDADGDVVYPEQEDKS